MKNIFVILMIQSLFFVGCAHKVKVLDAAAVSNSQYHLKKGQKTKEIGPVSGEFCTDSNDSGSIGLMDKAIDNASEKSGADFIINASFYSKMSCTSVEGTGVKIVK